MDVFTVASVGLALLEEASLPLGENLSRGDVVDQLYQISDTGETDRSDRVAWVIAAGGEIGGD